MWPLGNDTTDISTSSAIYPRAAMPVHPQQPSQHQMCSFPWTFLTLRKPAGPPACPLKAHVRKGLCRCTPSIPSARPNLLQSTRPTVWTGLGKPERLNPTVQNSKSLTSF